MVVNGTLPAPAKDYTDRYVDLQLFYCGFTRVIVRDNAGPHRLPERVACKQSECRALLGDQDPGSDAACKKLAFNTRKSISRILVTAWPKSSPGTWPS
jgi:hypothetical protein